MAVALVAAGPATTGPAALPWHHTLKDGYAESLKQNKPILLVLGAEWCGPCKVLEKEMATPDAARALARWTRVHLDVDNSEGAAAMLQSGAIPLLRVLSPTGRRVDFKEGAMTAADLVKWLDAAYDGAVAAAAGDELTGADPPDAAALAKLVARLADPDAALREAASKRLAPHAVLAAAPVAKAFASGNLLTRLACLDLLAEWKAPVDGLDPWQPDTLTTERLKALSDWAAAAAKALPATRPATKPTALTPRELDDARREIARLIAAPSQDEARAARERLARVGPVLLPVVQAALAEAGNGSAAGNGDAVRRERLLGLRYRLAAADALVHNWPGGLERLASGDASTRRAAADELVARATADDGPLLIELFADADPLVREVSLRGLQAVGKGDAAKALVTLLNDPDANVRAAVLKQLAATPPGPAMLASVVDFAAKESDPDLVVHAVRVLRESKSDRAIDGLLAILKHSQWRVRAEAAEALAEMTGHRAGHASAERQAQVQAAMVGLLDDPDGFVVSRAVTALGDADLSAAVDVMAKAATEHPELAGEIIRGLTRGNNTRMAAQGHLRTFCAHKDPAVRAQAVAALCSVSNDIEKEMKAALKDDAEGVRSAASAALFARINAGRPNGRSTTRVERGFLGLGTPRVVRTANDPWAWAVEYRAGKGGRTAWLNDLVPDLERLSSDAAASAESRLNAALPLLALGDQAKALDVIYAAVRAGRNLADAAAGALPWLPTDHRIELFRFLAPYAVADGHGVRGISEALAVVRDRRAAAPLWELLAPPETSSETASTVYDALRQIYFGEDGDEAELDAVTTDETPPPATAPTTAPTVRGGGKNTAVSDAIAHAAAGSEMSRLVALALLAAAVPAEAEAAAQKIHDDPASPAALRADALQIRLLSASRKVAIRTSIAALGSTEPIVRRIAVKYLATGGEDMNYVRGAIYLRISNPDVRSRPYLRQDTPVILEAPPGVTVAMIKPLLADGDNTTAAHAAYLLALLGDRSGLDQLIQFWRDEDRHDDVARRLVYRAIAALRADDLTPVLEDIYKGYEKQTYYVRDFYWTIRLIGGDRALLLRKKIRDEIGMDQLR